ncbi:mycofactocin biosynthesis peptidyl-dipeptidase MftE [Kutzneria kofuensis]|uniref:Creatinine amidohydrolase n=1 Tax=Kutzneria kofuensis TaxID=103725 RepID=A0A7W9KM57_9PSEU|nr:mycofactocin biosynthesis peptidyl-dipeptidase MftE [Kutzneria kofuensis]MBB5895124.1 creatinine amidohydrolase [Kutzneria kofuensis]
MNRLIDMAWPEVEAVAATSVLAVPVGSTEQHGPHLPFTVDTEIAAALCDRLAQARDRVVVAPAFSYGSSGEHAAFPGSLSIGLDGVETLVLELVRSADAFAGVLLVNGHGGNAAAVSRAVRRLGHEGRCVTCWSPTGSAVDSHAGRTETSVMLALRPESVRLDLLEPGDCRPLREIMPLLVRSGVVSVSANGVLGDPSGASGGEGRLVLERWTAGLLSAYDTWTPVS